MWIKKILFILLLFFLEQSTFAQVDAAKNRVEILCSDSLYGRGYVNNGMEKAARFIRHEFQSVGLFPHVGDSSYFQTFHYTVNTFPDTIKVKWKGKTLVPGVDYLVHQASGSFKGELRPLKLDTNRNKSQLILEQNQEKIRNHTINAFLIPTQGLEGKTLHTIQQQFNELANIGTVVYLTDQKLTWSVASTSYNYPILIVKDMDIQPIDSISIQIDSYLEQDFKANNVIGYLPSHKKNAKTIVFTAHYDHLGGMGTYPTTYFPGGNDNASGTAMLISLAEYYAKKEKTDYNFLFIAFAGEEAGLLGSNYYVQHPTMDLNDIHFLLNLDIMGSGEDGITLVNGRIFKKAYQKIVKINQKKGYLSQIKKRGEAANSDHYFFYKAGVPCFFMYTMGPNKNYHDVNDTYEALSFSEYEDILHLIIDFVKAL